MQTLYDLQMRVPLPEEVGADGECLTLTAAAIAAASLSDLGAADAAVLVLRRELSQGLVLLSSQVRLLIEAFQVWWINPIL
jgi:hypothetical protein